VSWLLLKEVKAYLAALSLHGFGAIKTSRAPSSLSVRHELCFAADLYQRTGLLRLDFFVSVTFYFMHEMGSNLGVIVSASEQNRFFDLCFSV
ncbi:hypothetical protein, partial [uncultured Vibrio sp.]|uniref:hypothetical protein n=1 Tax=uncultured Vibrio sp. TaxID=114054 RepID=UPI002636B018